MVRDGGVSAGVGTRSCDGEINDGQGESSEADCAEPDAMGCCAHTRRSYGSAAHRLGSSGRGEFPGPARSRQVPAIGVAKGNDVRTSQSSRTSSSSDCGGRLLMITTSIIAPFVFEDFSFFSKPYLSGPTFWPLAVPGSSHFCIFSKTHGGSSTSLSLPRAGCF
jgi:hypothetical protein